MHVVKQQSPLLALFKIWVMRLVETSQEPKISVLISTFQWVYNQIQKRIRLTPPVWWFLIMGRKQKVLIYCLHPYIQSPQQLFFCGIVSFVSSIFCFSTFDSTDKCALSTQNTQAAACRLWLCLANSRACFPYVFYEGHQATVVSPQNVGLEASSVPLQYYANLVWLRAALVEYWEERSRCTRRRCHWGSADVTVTQKQVKKKICKPRLVKSSKVSCLFISILHPQFQGFSDGWVVIPWACL